MTSDAVLWAVAGTAADALAGALIVVTGVAVAVLGW
jgi:hypothetical protein